MKHYKGLPGTVPEASAVVIPAPPPTAGTTTREIRSEAKVKPVEKFLVSSKEFINPDWNKESLEPYRKEYLSKDYVWVPNVFSPEYAKEITQWITKDMGDAWWYVASKWGWPDDPDPNWILNTPQNKPAIIEDWKKATAAFDKAYFSYQFDRDDIDHEDICSCKSCHFHQKIAQPDGPLSKFFAMLTGEKLTKSQEKFFTRYRSGQFLSNHHDGDRGKMAFTINLTQNWNHNWGGCLHLLNDDGSLKKFIPPTFNSVSVFKLVDKKGMDHYVSHVAPGINQARYAVSGWFE